MRYSFLMLLTLFSISQGISQFSLTYNYNINDSKWTYLNENQGNILEEAHDVSHEIGLSYWFKLKEKRVEFHPGFSYSRSSDIQENVADGSNYNYQWSSYFIQMPIHLYPLDFEGDCNCPTFSKEGGFFKKGFFVYVNPAVGYHQFDSKLDYYSFSNIFAAESKNTGINTRISAGLGLDIGIGDLLTITPSIGFAYATPLAWELIDVIGESFDELQPTENTASYTQWMPGIRLTFRPDYLREQRSMWR